MPPVSDLTLLRYCQAFYDSLAKTAKPKDGFELLWEGKLVEQFSSLGISNSHYSRITSLLQEIGCTQMVRRGARGVTTAIALHRRPEQPDLEGVAVRNPRLTNPTPYDTLSQRVGSLERRLEGIELKTYLANIENRLRKLENRRAGK